MAVGGVHRPRRRRGRRIVAVLLVLLILFVILFVADRVGRSVADDKVAQQVAQQAAKQNVTLGQQPTVDITGFPFLTQVVAGRYDKILVHLRDVQAQAYSIPKLDVAASGVHAKLTDVINGSGTITADRVDGTAVLGYGYLQKAVQDQLSNQVQVNDLTLSGSGGKLLVHATVSVLGQPVKVVGRTTLSLAGGGHKVRIDVQDLKPDGTRLPSFATDALSRLADQLSTTAELPDLPYHLKLTDINPASDGLRIAATAADVSLAQ